MDNSKETPTWNICSIRVPVRFWESFKDTLFSVIGMNVTAYCPQEAYQETINLSMSNILNSLEDTEDSSGNIRCAMPSSKEAWFEIDHATIKQIQQRMEDYVQFEIMQS